MRAEYFVDREGDHAGWALHNHYLCGKTLDLKTSNGGERGVRHALVAKPDTGPFLSNGNGNIRNRENFNDKC